MPTTTERSALGVSAYLLEQIGIACLISVFWSLIHTILIKIIPHFLMATSWLALPSYAAVSSRWDAHMYSPPCILGRARCSTALSVPRSPGGNNTQLHPLLGGWEWRTAFLSKHGRSTWGTAILSSSRHKNFSTAHLPHPEAFCSAASKFHRRGGRQQPCRWIKTKQQQWWYWGTLTDLDNYQVQALWSLLSVSQSCGIDLETTLLMFFLFLPFSPSSIIIY